MNYIGGVENKRSETMIDKKLIKDLERGEKDRAADIKTFGEEFVNYYKFKTATGVRYNTCSLDDMINYYKNRK